MPDYRRDFFDFSPTTYLDCAYHGPFPRSTAERIEHAIELKRNPAKLKSHHFFELPDRVRNLCAGLIGALPSEIALTNSATQGIGVVATGLGLKMGDEVVIASGNFPSNLFTWLHLRRLGVNVRVVEPKCGVLRSGDVNAALTPRTRVLALDWVSYTTGARIDLSQLGEMAHRQGSVFLVDGTQGVGALEMSVHDLPVDVLVVAAYKWLLGPYSTGFVYLTDDVRELLDLQVVNWLTASGSEEFDSLPKDEFELPSEARVFDVPATANFLNLYGLEASLEYVHRARVRTVTDHCRRLLDRLAEGVKRLGYRLSAAARPEHNSTILCFQAETLEATERLYEALSAKHVAVSLRHGMIRVSPYLYNDERDIEEVLSIVALRSAAP